MTELFFAPHPLGSKITEDGDCSHEIKRHLFFGKKGMTNLDSALKGRDIILLINVRIVKSLFFPVVMYGYENLIIKKAEHWKADAFELCPSLCDSLECSTLDTSVLHYFLEDKVAQIHVHWADDAILPSHPLPPPSFCLQSFSATESFPKSRFFSSGEWSIGASASAAVFLLNIRGSFPLGLTGLVSLQSRRHLGVFSRNNSKASAFQCSAFFIIKFSYPYMTTGKNKDLTIRTFINKMMSLP